MRACNRLLSSSSITAILLTGALVPAAAFAQTTTQKQSTSDATPDAAPDQITTPAAKKAKTDTVQSAGAHAATGVTSPNTRTAAAVQSQPATLGADVVVTGQRAALETAAEMKRQSDTIGDSIVLDEANKVPSTSLLEILQRIPGITENTIRAAGAGSPDGFAFEGSGIQVRGLSGTKALLNGREVFSANGGSGLSFQDIGPELLKAVTTYKASRADLIEGGIAGTIDLQTYMPFDFKGPKASLSVSGNYGDYSDKIEPSASFRASTRFHTPIGEIGFLGDVAYSKIESYDSNILVLPYYPTPFNGKTVYAPPGFSETADQFQRTRKGLYAALQWRPMDGLTFYHTTFISKWKSVRDTQLLVITGAPNIGVTADSTFDDGVFVKGGIYNQANRNGGIIIGDNASYTPSYSKEQDYSQGFNFARGRFTLSGSYEYTKADSGGGKYGLSMNGSYFQQIDVDTTSERPALGLQRLGFAYGPTPDPKTTVPSSFAWFNSKNTGHQDSYQLDASYDLGDGFFRKLAIGGRYADRIESDNFVGTYWAATAHGWNGVPQPNVSQAPSGDFRVEQFNNFFKGDLKAVADVLVPTSQVLRNDQFNRVVSDYAACGPNLLVQCSKAGTSTYLYGNPADPNLGTQPSFVTTKPTTKSAYVMVGFENHAYDPGSVKISGNLGVRWVNYRAESEGNYVFNGTTNFYRSLEDARASLAQIGGLDNLAAYQKALPAGATLPLTYTSVTATAARTGSFEKDYFLPAFNVKAEPVKNVILRYALTRTLTPPSYGDIRAQGSASIYTTSNPLAAGTTASGLPGIFNGYSYTSGNPTLKPETSINSDVSLEWYPRRGSSFHLSAFNKAISNYILYNRISADAATFFNAAEQPKATPPGGGAAVFLPGPIVANGNINADKKTIVNGVEVGARTYFDMLPGILKGFGIDANATYLDGHSPNALALDMNGNPLKVPLVALSKWSYTTTLLYDKSGLSGRVSWTWRSRYLTTTSDASTSGSYVPVGSPAGAQAIIFGLPVYGAASGRLDASLGYQFTKAINLQFNFQNITNTDQRTEMEILPDTYVQRGVFVTDRRLSLSASVNF